jgi:3-hydroxy-9,10-secoandrosta-1,3,5(10)-triene-9,17-dione monooxygenase
MAKFANEAAELVPVKFSRTREHPGADIPHEGLLDRVKQIAPLIASKAHEVESLRHPHDEVLEALQATGVFRAFVPKEYGGYEIDLSEFIDIGLEVAQACCSTGWLTTFYMEHNWIVSTFMGDETVKEIYSNQPYVLAPGSINPKGGEAKQVEGGFELSGRWHFSSGVVHGDWVILTAILPSDASPMKTFLLPREDVRVEDTWNIAGMRGTGSHDAVVDGVFVPEKYAGPFPSPRRNSDKHTHFNMYRLPANGFLPLTAAIPLVGAAKRALAIFKERLATRVQLLASGPQQESVSAQLRLGNVSMQVRRAETMLREAGRKMEAITVRGRSASMRETSELHMMVADAVRDARNAILSILEASGAGAHFEGSELQRIYRDVLTGSGHFVFDIDHAAETYGKAIIKSHNKDKELTF